MDVEGITRMEGREGKEGREGGRKLEHVLGSLYFIVGPMEGGREGGRASL